MRWLDLTDPYFLAVITLLKLGQWSRSHRLCDALATIIARIASAIPGDKRRRKVANLARCLGDMYSPKQRAAILRRTYVTFWRDVFALASAVTPASEPAKRVQVQGLEHLQQALTKGHGAILLESGFFGRRYLAKMILHAHGIGIFQVHGLGHVAGIQIHGQTRLRTHVIRPFFEGRELQFVARIIYLSAGPSLAFIRGYMNVLQENRVLCLSGEGQIGQKNVILPFLGHERAFVTGGLSLGKYSGAPILPLFCWQDADDQIRLVIEPPLDLQGGSKAAEAGTAAYARLLESYVLRYPFEYCGWDFNE